MRCIKICVWCFFIKEVDATCGDFDFGTSLHIAASNLCLSAVKCLLELGANPAFRVSYTALVHQLMTLTNSFMKPSHHPIWHLILSHTKVSSSIRDAKPNAMIIFPLLPHALLNLHYSRDALSYQLLILQPSSPATLWAYLTRVKCSAVCAADDSSSNLEKMPYHIIHDSWHAVTFLILCVLIFLTYVNSRHYCCILVEQELFIFIITIIGCAFLMSFVYILKWWQNALPGPLAVWDYLYY